LNLEALTDDTRGDREVSDVRKTGRTEVDLAILSYDERLMASLRPKGVRHPWTPCLMAQDKARFGSRSGRLLTVRKAIDVRA
jgi:hypothetical protein